MWWVRIEFSRVQTFLFAVPRLADILGANTLLGETLRYTLCNKAKKLGGALPVGITPPDILSTTFASNADPLEDKTLSNPAGNYLNDNPAHLYSQGILARDGGHFSALFACRDNADQFKRQAAAEIRKQLPGLRFSIDEPKRVGSDGQQTDGCTIQAASANTTHTLAPNTDLLIGLPSLQICQESSQGVASESINVPGEDELRYVSVAVAQRKRRGYDFRKKNTKKPPHDIASLLTRLLPGNSPTTFDELCGGHYLALIHADGNGIGDWSKRVRGKQPDNASLNDFLNHEAKGENFYHAMRVAVRGAVKEALEQVFHNSEEPAKKDSKSVNSYRILMLGGDDLLLACRAPYALKFVEAYAQALENRRTLPDIGEGKDIARPLTVGIGVAIAKPSFPFHRLHQIAEQLAASAKRLIRGKEATHASVVDWTVCSEAWLDDVEAARSADSVNYRCGTEIETLALSSKPYFVLDSAVNDNTAVLGSHPNPFDTAQGRLLPEGEGAHVLKPTALPFNGEPAKPKPWTLQSLLNSAEILKAMPRSQRRTLATELSKGRRHADLYMKNLKRLSPESWKALQDAGLSGAQDEPALWRPYGGGCYATVYADMVEITELPNLKLADRDETGAGGTGQGESSDDDETEAKEATS